MYYFSALFYVAIGYSFLPNALPSNLSVGSWLTTFTLTNGWNPDTINGFVPGGWSIAAEMMFYLSFPVLLRLKDRRWISLVITVISFIVSVALYKAIIHFVPGKPDDVASFAYFFWLTQLPAFLCGISIAAWLPFLQGYQAIARSVFPIAALLTVMAALSRGAFSSYIVADILFATLVLSASLADFVFMRNKVLTYVGTVSFSIYLTHFFVIRLLMAGIRKLPEKPNGTILVLGGYAIALIAATIISSVTYPLIEISGKNIGNALLRYRREKMKPHET